VRFEDIAVRDKVVGFARLPFLPQVLEEGCWYIFRVVVFATTVPEEVETKRQAQNDYNDDDNNLDRCC
jgi:hypothetical protein